MKPHFSRIVFLAIISQFLFSAILIGGNETNIWYFGDHAGLDFSGGAPTALTDGDMYTNEGSSTICDSAGSLLFYTNGVRVWNREGRLTPNGEGLGGSLSSSQSALIVPKPGRRDLFYIFTAPREMAGGFCYSIFDMNLDGGFGDVAEKNVLLHSPASEQLTAALHANGTNIWVIMHEGFNNVYRSYLVDENGVSGAAVISAVGSVRDSNGYAGYLKAAPSGRKLAAAFYKPGIFEIYDFDNSTGKASNPITLKSPKFLRAYGVEFSPDCSKLYAGIYSTILSKIYQFDFTAGSKDDIYDSGVILTDETDFDAAYAAMQLGPDGKIYIADSGEDALAVVERPDERGAACGFKKRGVSLGRQCLLGLPNFMQSYFSMECDESAFEFSGFKAGEHLVFVGSAAEVDGVARISDASRFSCGAVWYEDLIPVKKGFTTTFRFRLDGGDNNSYDDGSAPGADGLAFVIQNASPTALGKAGYGIGYHGVPNSLTVEFDSYANDSLQLSRPGDHLGDPDGNHIAVQSNGRGKNSASHEYGATLGIAPGGVDFIADGRTYYVKIDYHVVPYSLRVFIDSAGVFDRPALVVKGLDLSSRLDLSGGGGAYIGFTSATGNAVENHDILDWSFCPSPYQPATGVGGAEERVRPQPSLSVFPNPSAGECSVELVLEKPGYVSLSAYTILGKKIDVLADGFMKAGKHRFQLSRRVENGVYFIWLETQGSVAVKQVYLIR